MNRATWFEEAFGFSEGSYSVTQRAFRMEGYDLICPHEKWPRQHVGAFECASVAELRARALEVSSDVTASSGGIHFRHISGDVKDLHLDSSNSGAVFLAASQFNCLEMVNPGVSPRQGISCYQFDQTQGPACAMACPAGTAFRNYFVGGQGQGEKQLNCLSGIEALLHTEAPGTTFWDMTNGYAIPKSPWSMKQLGSLLSDQEIWDHAAKELRVGVHWDTQCAPPAHHRVCQVYASAIPVAYARNTDIADFEPFARLVLNAAYDATLLAARVKQQIMAAKQQEGVVGARTKVYLTLLGGGAFGNRIGWITDAIIRALEAHKDALLDVFLVHYGNLDGRLVACMAEWEDGARVQ